MLLALSMKGYTPHGLPPHASHIISGQLPALIFLSLFLCLLFLRARTWRQCGSLLTLNSAKAERTPQLTDTRFQYPAYRNADPPKANSLPKWLLEAAPVDKTAFQVKFYGFQLLLKEPQLFSKLRVSRVAEFFFNLLLALLEFGKPVPVALNFGVALFQLLQGALHFCKRSLKFLSRISG